MPAVKVCSDCCSGSVRPPGTDANSQKTFTVAIADDDLYEGVESFYVNLSGPVGATITDNQGVVTVTDNETEPTLAAPRRQ